MHGAIKVHTKWKEEGKKRESKWRINSMKMKNNVCMMHEFPLKYFFWDEWMFSFCWLCRRRVCVSLSLTRSHTLSILSRCSVSWSLKMRVVYFVFFFSVHCFAWLGFAFLFSHCLRHTHRAAQIKITKTKWNQRFSKHTILLQFFFLRCMRVLLFLFLSFSN